MRVITAFFAGVGTVGVAIAAGLGGGLVLGELMSPQQPKHPSSEVTRLEQRASQQPIQAMNGATQPVPYMATPQVAATVAEPSAQQPPQPQQQTPQPQQAQPQVQQASTQPVEQKQPERNPPAQSTAAAPPAAAPVTAPEDAQAKARDTDLKRDAGRTEDRDRRKAERRQQWDERRQQWVEKRKWRQRQDDDLRDVEASVRETTESRPMFGREPRIESRERGFGSRDLGFFGGRESGSGSGRFGLFDD
jgi:outer membrane biosynthesis protein TonB